MKKEKKCNSDTEKALYKYSNTYRKFRLHGKIDFQQFAKERNIFEECVNKDKYIPIKLRKEIIENPIFLLGAIQGRSVTEILNADMYLKVFKDWALS